MTTHPYGQNVGLLLGILLGLTALVVIPKNADAAYTYAGHSFATYEEYVAFVVEYQRVYGELHGGNTLPTPSQNAGAARNTDTSGHSNKSAVRAFAGTVNTSVPSSVSHSSARLKGTVMFTRSTTGTVWFEYGTQATNLDLRTAPVQHATKYVGSSFDAKAQGLRERTKYYFRAVARDTNGAIAYGKTRSFTTGYNTESTASKVRVSTSRAYDVDDNGATFWASVNYGTSPFATVWFEYGEEIDDLDHTTWVATRYAATDGQWTSSMPWLESNTTYYMRAVAADDLGVRHYGKIVSFTTRKDVENELPVLTAARAEAVGTHSATLVGTVDMNDFEDGIVFFVYGESREDVAASISENTYRGLSEKGDARQKVLLETDAEGRASYRYSVSDLDAGTRHYYGIAVQFEWTDGKDYIMMSKLQLLTTLKVRS